VQVFTLWRYMELCGLQTVTAGCVKVRPDCRRFVRRWRPDWRL